MRLRKEQLERREFYQMPKWLYEIKGLKSIDREIYMLGYNNWRLSEKNNWINERGEIYFELSIQKLMDRTNETKRSIIASLKTLVDAGIFEVEKLAGKPTKFFLVELTDRAHSIEVSRKLTEKQRKVTGYEIVPSSEIVTSVESATGSSVEIVPTNQVRNRTPSNNDLSKNNFSKKHVTCNGESEKQKIEDPKKEVTLNPKGYPQKDKWENFLNENLVGIDYTPGIETAIKKLEVNMSEKQIKESLSFTYENGKATGRTLGEIATIIERGNALRSKEKVEVKPKVEEKEEPKMNPKFDTKGPNFIDTTDPKVISEYFENKETLEISPEEEEKALNILRVQGSINHILAMKNNKKLYINTLRQVLAGA